ncbi:UbiA prenyltransferase family-domain-containing protein [Xylaria cubensis]|nr:UbiA prenyltransferase family-domain-containing protein [Xylaria cubensis]
MDESSFSIPLHTPSPTTIFKFFTYHIYTIYLFSCNNILDIIIPGILFGSLNASIASKLSLGDDLSVFEIAKSIPKMLLWAWSNLLFFNLSNQRHSIEEDTLNKPWRPLPSGRLNQFQANMFFYCMYPAIAFISLTVGGLLPSLMVIILSFLYDNNNAASNPLLKNLINGVGIVSLFTGPLEVATRSSILEAKPGAIVWIGILMATIATTSHIQDLRDMDGDRAAGRSTVPIAIGAINSRFIGAFGILGWTAIACYLWNARGPGVVISIGTGVAMASSLVLYRNKAGDVFTWKLFPLWMVGLFLVPVLSV